MFTESSISVAAGDVFDPAVYQPWTPGWENCSETIFSVDIGEVLYIHCTTTLFHQYVVVYIAVDAPMVLTVCELEVYQEQGNSKFLLLCN